METEKTHKYGFKQPPFNDRLLDRNSGKFKQDVPQDWASDKVLVRNDSKRQPYPGNDGKREKFRQFINYNLSTTICEYHILPYAC